MTRTPFLFLVFLALFIGGQTSGTGHAQTLELRAYRVNFPVGSVGTTIRETLTGAETILYRVSARAGQVLQVNLDSNSSALFFTVYPPGRWPGDTPLAVSTEIGALVPSVNRFQGALPRNGDYAIAVSLFSSAANRGERAPFSLGLRVTQGGGQLPGGPSVNPPTAAFLKVAGVGAGDRLNVRSGPSTGNRVLFTLSNGAIARNLGCEATSGGTTWCRIQPVDRPDLSGWAAASFLVASADPGAAGQLPALPPGGDASSATGTLRCMLEFVPLECRYSITRRGAGDATLSVVRPFARDRVIEFRAGRPVSSNASEELFSEIRGGNVIVRIGSKESFTVPNSVLFER